MCVQLTGSRSISVCSLGILAGTSPRFKYGIVQRGDCSKGENTQLFLATSRAEENEDDDKSEHQSSKDCSQYNPDGFLFHSGGSLQGWDSGGEGRVEYV